jgi:hypothetical protein
MQTQELETRSAGRYAYFAAQDAAVKSYAASTHYTSQQKLNAERKKLVLEMAYYGEVHINYRKKFVALKVANTNVQNRKLLRELEQDFSAQNIVRVQTPQGVVYRIPKN